MHFGVEQVEGGWIVNTEDSQSINVTKVIVKDSELVKQFKQFVESAKSQVLNEG